MADRLQGKRAVITDCGEYNGADIATLFREEGAEVVATSDDLTEWRAIPDGKQPYAIATADGQPLVSAGLWEGWRAPTGEVLRTFCIMTTNANWPMRQLDDRMPVILEEADWPTWLGEAEGDPVSLLLRPAPDDTRSSPPDQAARHSARL